LRSNYEINQLSLSSNCPLANFFGEAKFRVKLSQRLIGDSAIRRSARVRHAVVRPKRRTRCNMPSVEKGGQPGLDRGRDSLQLHPTCRSRGSRRRRLAGRERSVECQRHDLLVLIGALIPRSPRGNVVMSYSGESCARNRRCAAPTERDGTRPDDRFLFPPFRPPFPPFGIIRPAHFFRDAFLLSPFSRSSVSNAFCPTPRKSFRESSIFPGSKLIPSAPNYGFERLVIVFFFFSDISGDIGLCINTRLTNFLSNRFIRHREALRCNLYIALHYSLS